MKRAGRCGAHARDRNAVAAGREVDSGAGHDAGGNAQPMRTAGSARPGCAPPVASRPPWISSFGSRTAPRPFGHEPGNRVRSNSARAGRRRFPRLEARPFGRRALLAAWTWWMFAARVPQYESTTNVRIESGRAIAYFPPDALAHIRAGQPRSLHSTAASFQPRFNRSPPTTPNWSSPPAPNPQPRLRHRPSADIEIARVSPAAIALRSLARRNR